MSLRLAQSRTLKRLTVFFRQPKGLIHLIKEAAAFGHEQPQGHPASDHDLLIILVISYDILTCLSGIN